MEEEKKIEQTAVVIYDEKKIMAVGAERQYEKKGLSIFEEAKTIQVVDAATMWLANSMIKACEELETEIDSSYDPIIEANKETKRKADQARAVSVAQKEKVAGPVKKAKQWLLDQIGGYRKREQDKLDAIAKAEQDRLRKIEEDKRLAEVERIERDKAEKQKEVDRLISEGKGAEALKVSKEAAALEGQAETLLEQPIVTPVVKAATIEKPEGRKTRTYWKHEVVDFSRLPDSYKLPNTVLLNSIAETQKEKAKIDGVRFFADTRTY